MKFVKASLQELKSDPADPPKPAGDPVEVQINPATLRLQATASVDARKDSGRQRTQYQGTTSSLSFDLVFDTSDEGTTEKPVDVRDRTASVERFVWPPKKGDRPPRVRFTYGTLSVVGVMKSLSTDLDLFTASGVPLRAKCAVTIEEQKPAFDLNQQGPGSRTGAGATDPLRPGTASSASSSPAAGAVGGPPPPTDRCGTALGGESASSFANRMGLDPRAWKGLQGLTDPLSLTAGLEIDFDSTLSLDAGLGVTTGAGAKGGPTTSTADGAGAVPRQLGLDQQALTTAGGLTRALDAATAARVRDAAAVTAAAFSAEAGGTPGATGSTGSTGTSGSDPRARTYGYGVPLRPRRSTPTPGVVGVVHSRSHQVRRGGEQPPESRTVGVPSWLGLGADPDTGQPCAAHDCHVAPQGCGCGGTS